MTAQDGTTAGSLVEFGMEETVEKLKKLEREAASEKGGFAIFGLFLRVESPNRWDLVASAPWLEENKREGLRYLVEKLQRWLDEEERLLLSRVVILENDNPLVQAIQKFVAVEHGLAALKGNVLFGLEFDAAYVITSKKE